MRKYLIGILIGAALTITSSAFADDIKNVIGKVIQGQFQVEINGHTLDKSAIVVDGSSYLPVRAMGDALGLDVSFDADMGIKLIKREVEVLPTEKISTTVTENTYDDVQEKIKIIDIGINEYKQMLSNYESDLKTLNSKPSKSDFDVLLIKKAIDGIEKAKAAIEKAEQRKAALTQ